MWIRIKQTLTPRSFRFKVVAVTVICIMVPAVITLYVYSYLTKDAMKEQAMVNAERELSIAGAYVSKLLDDMLYAVNFVQLDSEMNTILKKNANHDTQQQHVGYEDYLEDQKVTKTIENMTLLGEKSYVTILLKNGKHYTNYPVADYNPEQLFHEAWFKELDEVYGYETIWIGSQPTVFASEQDKNRYQLSVARTLRDANLQIYGYVIVTMMETEIKQAFAGAGGSGEMLLVDGSNRILSHRDSEQIGATFSPMAQVQNASGANVIELENETYIYADYPLSYTGWKLVSVNPYKQAISKMNRLFDTVFFAQLISFVVFFLLLTSVLKTVTSPLVHLGHIATKVQSGKLNVRADIQSQDEIGRLSHSFNQMLDHINEMINEITETQARKRQAELAMLQAQINPHFLFNVLNSIRMKVMRKGDDESAEMISSLSKLLRMTIDKDKGMIPLQEEVEIVNDFVKLMNMRQREKVRLLIDVSAKANAEMIPRFILQPIIENSMIHGLNQCAGTISLKAYSNEQCFFIIIKDNGQGMNEETLKQVRKSLTFQAEASMAIHINGFSNLGISNVYERMRMTFADTFNMDIESVEGLGTKVVMCVSRGGKKSNV
ncbi:sensor histidine kinase [Shouchella clausii]|uniref:cache domain-containing sensor histidine kinase n=1 Tax=Shouchella clausii TaxID=79880 RepID=UPI003983CE6A